MSNENCQPFAGKFGSGTVNTPKRSGMKPIGMPFMAVIGAGVQKRCAVAHWQEIPDKELYGGAKIKKLPAQYGLRNPEVTYVPLVPSF